LLLWNDNSTLHHKLPPSHPSMFFNVKFDLIKHAKNDFFKQEWQSWLKYPMFVLVIWVQMCIQNIFRFCWSQVVIQICSVLTFGYHWLFFIYINKKC
jgi:hypothetical protein